MNFHADNFYFNLNAAHQNETQSSLSQESLQNNPKQNAEDFSWQNDVRKNKIKTSIKIRRRKKRGLL